MTLFIRGLKSPYEIEMLSRMLFPGLKFPADTESPCGDEDYIDTSIVCGDEIYLSVTVKNNGDIFSESGSMPLECDEKECVRELSRMLYRCAIKSGREEMRWGTLSGVRPIKLFHNLAAQGVSEQEANQIMKREFLISDEMAQLAQQIRRTERSEEHTV